MIKLLFRLKRSMLPLMVFSIAVLALGAYSGDGYKKGSNYLAKTNADFVVLNFNNMWMPLDNKGVIAEVTAPNGLAGGRFQDKVFLFAGGFYMSGFSGTRQWGNGVMAASRITDYVAGPVGSSQTDSKNRMYLVTVQDPAFGPAWQDWKDAVAIGADFYDGDKDGVYNPQDKNGNGVWDVDEDRPDLIGDFTCWCVYNDGLAKALRRFTDVDPQGIEIRQSVFGFSSKGVIGNMLFVRYRLVNRGTVANTMDSVYFSVACDPDLGDSGDDFVGCDTVLSCAYTYNNGPDATFGQNPPCFMVDFFQGPVSYIPGVTYRDNNSNGVYDAGDTPLKYAYNVKGKVKGIDTLPGAMNLPLTSFTQYMQSHPTHGDPNTQYEMRNYIKGGLSKEGVRVDPCTWAFGNGSALSNCAQVDPKFMYSGDPVRGTGWLNTTPIDQRQMSNTGPFKLEKDKPVDIVVVYLVGQGSSAINSVDVTKGYDITAQKIFDSNFPSPPPPPPVTPVATTGDGYIDITWPTSKQVTYRAVDNVLDIDRRFQGYYVTAFATNSKSFQINGVENAKVIATYDLKDSINSIYQTQSNGGIVLRQAAGPDNNKLDSLVYSDPTQGRVKLIVTTDPVNGGPLVKGKEYFFVVTNYTLNNRYIVNKNTGVNDGRLADYTDISGSGVDEFESAMIRVVYGKDIYSPALAGGNADKTGGASPGAVKYLVADNSQLTGDNYAIEFFKDSAAATYSTYWRLKNTTKGTTLIDSSKNYNFDSTNYSGKVTEGFIARVKPVTPALGTPTYTSATSSADWFDELAATSGTGLYYVGTDITAGGFVSTLPGRSTAIGFDKARKVEIRFDKTKPGKAYRYINGFIGTGPIAPQSSFQYAGGIKATDTTGKGIIGKFGEGFVDVPFTAWVKDTKYNEERQLAVGFVERRKSYGGTPDGEWNPLDSIMLSREYIIVFDADYDPTGSQKQYTGGTFSVTGGSDVTVWADLVKGFTIPDNAVGITAQQRKVAKSPWFNTMYVMGVQRATPTSTFGDGDKFTIPITTYPYTSADKFTFTTSLKGELTADAQKDLFNKVNVFPNPLFAYNPQTSYNASGLDFPDDPFVTFSNLPSEVTIKIYSLSGTLLRTLSQSDKADGVSSPFLRWNLKNESGLRVASGMYLAIVTSPKYGEKILKFGVILPQKQIRNY